MKSRILIILSALTLDSCGQGQANTYNLDMFSLISFALAIASILFAGFAVWLSWELYKKSTAASEKTQEAVIRIESAVLGIKGDITEIVKRAVSYWVEDNPQDQAQQGIMPDLTEKLDEISQTIKSLSTTDPKVKELESKLKEVVNTQKQEIEKLNSSLLDAKVKNIFPSASSFSAISLHQQILDDTPTKKSGQLLIKINRPVKIATATGKFLPSFENTPMLTVKLISSPYRDKNSIHVTSGIGQFSDFHVHLKIPGTYLAEGDYVVEYEAKVI